MPPKPTKTKTKTKAITPFRALIPESLAAAPILQQKKIGRKGLARFNERVLLLFAPEMVPTLMATILKKVQQGDKDAIRLAAEMFNFTERSGIKISNNIINQNSNASACGDGRSFDAIVRQLSQAPIDVTPREG